MCRHPRGHSIRASEIEIPVESPTTYSTEIGALNMAKASLSLTSSETPASTKETIQPHWLRAVGRRSFLKGLGMAGATVSTGALWVSKLQADEDHDHDRSGRLTKGDAAILRFLAAAEIIESDLWLQYQQLGGVEEDEVSKLASKLLL